MHMLAMISKSKNSKLFQFPSNGKAYMHKGVRSSGTSPPAPFQFPSNGKAYMHITNFLRADTQGVFQFPSNGKAYMHQRKRSVTRVPSRSFNSLQTGKHICTKEDRKIAFAMASEVFQFPSNGKAYMHEQQIPDRTGAQAESVSIPFKRESIYALNN